MIPARPNSSSELPPGCDVDLERIASFVDGTLDDAEREQLVAHLATCAACSELVAETAALADDAELVASMEAALDRPRGGDVADEPLIQATAAPESSPNPLDELAARERTPEHLTEMVTSGEAESGAEAVAESGALDAPLQPSQGRAASLDAARAERRKAAETIHSEAAGAGRWFAIAAGVLALVALGWWLSTRAGSGLDTHTLVADLGSGPALREGLPPGWIDGRWDVMRGPTAVISAPADAAFQLGARSVDLAVALRAEDGATARDVVLRIQSVLDAIDLPNALTIPAFQLAQELRVPKQDLSKARNAAESFDDALTSVRPSNAVTAGRWAAAAQVAAMTENAAFFASSGWTQGLDLIGAASASGNLREIAGRLRAVDASALTAADFEAIERDARAVLRLLGDGEASLDQPAR